MVSALALALLAAVEPLGIIAFIAILGSRGGRRNTRGFIIGWVLSACVVAALTTLAHGSDLSVDSSTVVGSTGLLQVALGLVALGYLVHRRRRETLVGEQADQEVPQEDRLGPVGAALIGAGVQGWPVVAAAVAAVLSSTSSTGGRLLGVAAVVLVCTSTYLTAHVLSGRQPERTAERLHAIKAWIESHRERVIQGLLLVAGVWLVGHGVVAWLAT